MTLNPPASELPEELRHNTPGFVARRNGKSVLVEIWTRGRVNDLPPTLLPVGWNFDAVLLPPPEYPDSPGPGNEATSEFTGQLLDELDNLLPKKAARARFFVAWSAAESAMRVTAQSKGIESDRLPPKSVARELVTVGMLSREQYERFGQLLDVRKVDSHTAFPAMVREAEQGDGHLSCRNRAPFWTKDKVAAPRQG